MVLLKRLLLLAALACALLTTGSAAVSTIAVEVNGAPVTFTDAAPEIVNDRTFLPCLAICEALGAQATYEAETHTAVIVRGDYTIRMPIGGTLVYILRGGETTVLEMDVASYVKNDRTFVPVRFVAEALDCAVGWDRENNVAILLDTAPLAAAAMEGKHYELLARGRDFLALYSGGRWAVEGELSYDLCDGETVVSASSGTFTGLTDAGIGSQVVMTVTAGEVSITAEGRSDAAGNSWLSILEASGAGTEALPLGVWAESGTGFAINGAAVDLLPGGAITLDPTELITAALTAVEPTDRVTAMEEAAALAGRVATALADGSYVVEDGLWTAAWTVGGTVCTLTFAVDELGEVTGLIRTETAVADGAITVTRTSLDSAGNVSVETSVTASERTLTAVQTARYTPTEEPPVVTVP